MGEIAALVIPVGIDLYALDLGSAKEVVADPHITPLPTAPSVVLGVFNLRGDIVPIFDTPALMGLGTVGHPTHAVVIETSAGPAALAATDLPQAGSLEGPIGSSEAPGTLGVYSVGSAVTVLMEIESLLAPTRTEGTGAGSR